MALFVGNNTVNDPGQVKISVNSARSKRITASERSGLDLASSRTFGMHPSTPFSGFPKSNALQNDVGAIVGSAFGMVVGNVTEGTGAVGTETGAGTGFGGTVAVNRQETETIEFSTD